MHYNTNLRMVAPLIRAQFFTAVLYVLVTAVSTLMLSSQVLRMMLWSLKASAVDADERQDEPWCLDGVQVSHHVL
jgi:hypothetical protein